MDRNRWILLVEDNEDDVILMNRALGEFGLPRVVTARDGVEALEVLAATGDADDSTSLLPELVLLDLNLPRLNGWEVLEKIRTDVRTRLLRVVIFTTSAHEADLSRGYESGANSYVRKPIDSSHFQKTVDSIGRYWLQLNQSPLVPAD